MDWFETSFLACNETATHCSFLIYRGEALMFESASERRCAELETRLKSAER